MRKALQITGNIAIALLLAGCMGYQLGGGKPAGIETVSMAPVINQTAEPAIELQVTHALRDRIQFDGRLKLVDAGDFADGIIEVHLTRYEMTPIAYRGDKTTMPQVYRLRITGKAALRRSDTGNIIATSETYGEATFPFQSDLTSAKRDALPAAATEIAKFMVDDLIEQW
jgi:hypothetical protein